MWTLVVAVVTLLGTVLVTTWSAGRRFRERKVLKEEAELLAALPDSLEARDDLRSHLSSGVSRYVRMSDQRHRLARERLWGAALLAVAANLSLWWVAVNTVEVAVVDALFVVNVGFAATIVCLIGVALGVLDWPHWLFGDEQWFHRWLRKLAKGRR